jgi:hypothetical protein
VRAAVMLSNGSAGILRFPQNDGMGDSYNTPQSVTLSECEGSPRGRW